MLQSFENCYQNMDAGSIKHLFVSHYHEDEEHIKGMKELLGDSYKFQNSSVTSDKFNRANNPDYIKSLLRSRITWAKTVVCLIGPKTHDSEWVDYEIRNAAKQGKRIVGVFVRGATDSDVPPALEEFADAIVGWNKDSILGAINGASSFSKADGSARDYGSGSRTTC